MTDACCCTATATLRGRALLRCHRTAGHETIPDATAPERDWHYDLYQDADWQNLPDEGYTIVEYRTVGSDAR
jgi:hypothetical protein